MSLMFAKSFQGETVYTDSSAAARKAPGKKTGVMGKGKSHQRGRPDDPGNGSNNFSSDGDANYRTHLLFAGRGGEDTSQGGRSGSPSILQAMFGGGAWGRRSGPSLPLDVRGPAQESGRSLITSEIESFNRLSNKQVSFVGGENSSEIDVRPGRKPNSYNCDPPVQMSQKVYGTNYTPLTGSSTLPFMKGTTPQPTTTRSEREIPKSDVKQPPIRRTHAQQPVQAFPEDSLNSNSRHMNHPVALGVRNEAQLLSGPSSNLSNDCFVIPQENLERFLPDGITLPQESKSHPLINVLEVDDPKLVIIFHLMAPFTSLSPHLESPLSTPLLLQRKLAEEELEKSKELQASQGFLLKNLEKDSEYPFINYFVIHKSNQEARTVFKDLRSHTYDAFCPTKVGYSCQHSFDLYDEVATIARPPVDILSKKPISDLTGYIICLYRVFKGDDGEKFERNWLFWTGARMLYKNLPKAVGLRRVALHKSITNEEEVVYLLLVECTHFMDHIGEAANLLPILRARICGYTGIFRVAESFG